jgi:CBS domain-containing protein
MLVREVMSTTPMTVSPGTPIKVALRMLMDAKVTSLPVVGQGDRLVGIVSEADLIRDRLVADTRLHEIPREDELVDRHQVVDEVMTTHVVTVGPDTDVMDAVELLTSTAVKSVPVVGRDGRVVGMLSRSDVVRVLAEEDVVIERDVDAALTSVGLRDWWVEVSDGAVQLVAPSADSSCELARVIAATVPGVTSVTVRTA